MPDDGQHEESPGVVARVTQAVSSTLGRLPGEFLGLVLITAVFNLGMIWLFNQQNAARERILGPLVAACADSVPMEALKLLAKPHE